MNISRNVKSIIFPGILVNSLRIPRVPFPIPVLMVLQIAAHFNCLFL